MGTALKSNRKILVVDDNETIVISITKVLTKEGYKTDYAYNGNSAVEKALQNNYGLILLDITLPDIDGYQVCTELRKHNSTRFIPIIFISTLDDDKIYDRGFELGVMDYLKKPIPSAELVFRIKNYLRLAETENKLRQSELLFRSIVNDQTEFVVRYKPDGTLTFVNSAFSHYLQKSTHDLLGANFFELLGIEPGPELNAGVSRPGQTVRTDTIQVSLNEDRKVWHQWIQRTILDRTSHKVVIQSIGRDITENKIAEDNMRRWEHIFTNAPFGILVTSSKSVEFEQMNRAYAEMHGYTVSELKNRKISTVYKKGSDKMIREIIEKVKAEGHYSYDSVHIRKDGQEFSAHTDLSMMTDEEGNKMLLAVVQDITKQKEIDRQILQTIISTEEKERSRFAQDLHDDLGPLLSTAKLYIRSFETAADARNRDIAVNMSMKAIDEAIMSIRQIANNISPHVLRNFGFISGIQSFISKINETNSIKISFTPETDARFDENTESSLFRIVAELVNNTIKHSGARNAMISFSMKADTLTLKYSDDGTGFDLEQALEKNMSRGLTNILNRVTSLGGEIIFAGKSRKGFSSRITIPVAGRLIK